MQPARLCRPKLRGPCWPRLLLPLLMTLSTCVIAPIDSNSSSLWPLDESFIAQQPTHERQGGLVFVRIPKTGSTTLRPVVLRVCNALWPNATLVDKPNIAKRRRQKYRHRQPPQGWRCTAQHMVLGPWLFRSLPSLRSAALVSVVRDPFRRALSLLHNSEGFCSHYIKKTPPSQWPAMGVGWLAKSCPLARDGQLAYLGGIYGRYPHLFKGSGLDLNSPTRVAARYDALLVIERLEESLEALLAKKLGLPAHLCRLPQGMATRANVGRVNTSALSALSPEDKARFWDLNRGDRELYAVANTLLNVQIREHATSQERMRKLREHATSQERIRNS